MRFIGAEQEPISTKRRSGAIQRRAMGADGIVKTSPEIKARGFGQSRIGSLDRSKRVDKKAKAATQVETRLAVPREIRRVFPLERALSPPWPFPQDSRLLRTHPGRQRALP